MLTANVNKIKQKCPRKIKKDFSFIKIFFFDFINHVIHPLSSADISIFCQKLAIFFIRGNKEKKTKIRF